MAWTVWPSQSRTLEVQREIENYFNEHESKNIKTLFTVAGGGGGGGAVGQNTGQGFLNLAPWDDRPGKENTADAIVARASGAFRNFRDAQVFALVPGAIRGLGQSSGFTMELQNRSGMTREQFLAARDQLLQQANSNSKLTAVRSGNVVALDDDVASRWGPRVVGLVQAVAGRLARLPAGSPAG